jgi:hypothetical protein
MITLSHVLGAWEDDSQRFKHLPNAKTASAGTHHPFDNEIAWYLEQNVRHKEHEQRDIVVVPAWIHVQVAFEALDACITYIRAVEEGKKEEQEENGDYVNIAFPEEFALVRGRI